MRLAFSEIQQGVRKGYFMAHAAFDTLEFVDRLEKSGLSEKQVRAITYCDHFIDTYIMTPAIAAAHPDTSMSCSNVRLHYGISSLKRSSQPRQPICSLTQRSR